MIIEAAELTLQSMLLLLLLLGHISKIRSLQRNLHLGVLLHGWMRALPILRGR